MRASLIIKSGGGQYPYPKWVWSTTGGWWSCPKNWKQNTAIVAGGILIASVCLQSWYSKSTRRATYPTRWIFPMWFQKEFTDPEHIEYWKEMCRREKRHWVDPKTGEHVPYGSY